MEYTAANRPLKGEHSRWEKTELWSGNYQHVVFRCNFLFSLILKPAKAPSTEVRLPCISHKILQLKNSHPAAVDFWWHGETTIWLSLIQKSHLFLSHEIATAREFTWLFWVHMIKRNSLISEEHFAKTAFFKKIILTTEKQTSQTFKNEI